ncbi:FxSxx-COOH system tetratricopeptide repeat protein [Nocardia sp. NPDC050435]|uniref:FxSxx-COOH system tetratricopeptide repeat protein n=1 Tax=Nocardia sp. NPDC050435 TaxID=3155040 RepID=UPI0033D37539
MSRLTRSEWEDDHRRGPVAASTTHAEGARSAAIGPGSVVGAVFTGDNAQATVVPPEAFRPMAEVEAPPGIDNLPSATAHFVGRDHELTRLDAALADSGRVMVQAVHGLGGIGKTTLVARWAATRAHGHTPRWWITAENPARVEQGLAKFATVLQPALARVLTDEQLAERAVQWLATHSGWLLVLDNVEDPADIEPVLARARGGRIVLTSRLATGWARTGATVVRVDVLDPADSVELLSGLVTEAGPRDLDGAPGLCQELGHLPLAIEQAGAYLAQTLLTPAAYLDLLARYPAQMYQHGGESTEVERTIDRIWRLTLDRIVVNHPVAADILRTLAWFAPDTIPLTLLDGLADPPTLHAALGSLTAYSLVTLDPAGGTVSVHRLVQAVARTPTPDDPQRLPAAIERAHEHAATALWAALPNHRDPATWPAWRILVPHIDALITYTTHDSPTIANILAITGLFLTGQGMTGKGIEYLLRALTDRERVLELDHPDILTSRGHLACAYWSAGRASEAITLFERTLADRERVFGPDHPDTLTSRGNLAGAYWSAGRTSEAITLSERTLADRERVFGPDHPDTLASRGNLASAYWSAGRTSEAIPLFERTLADRERVLGPDHPDTLATRNNLANAYWSAGRTSEAIPLFEQTLTDRERVLGPDHPDTLTVRGNLANAYESAGRTSQAITLYEQTLTDQERVLGPDHPDILTTRNNLANAYQSAGRTGEAITLLEQNLTQSERILGPDHPHILIIRNNLANAYQSAGRTSQAITLYEQTLTDQDRVLGPDHPHILTTRNNLANAYQSAGRTGEAITLYEQTLTDQDRVLGPDHPDILTTRNNLANAYQSVGRTGDAVTLLEQTLTDQDRILGPDHPDILTTRNNLANAYQSAGRTGEAITLLEQNHTQSERILGPDHPHILTTRNNLANAYQSAGRTSEAITLLEQNRADQE